jgi:cold shock CspA family protein/uncharacterized LabA/DUF88 family protein
MIEPDNRLVRIAVFYDGNYFSHVSNYYNYQHPRHARIDFYGLHDFVRHQIASEEGTDVRYCQIVDAHYFRGRKAARDANLVAERQFDEVLMRAGITTHYTPLTRFGEKGIDVWLALEAFELVILKKYSVVVLIAGDSDYLPLIRKLATFGARVLLLGWHFKYVGSDGVERETRTSQSLLDEATYPVLMSDVMDDPERADDALIEALFVRRSVSLIVNEERAPDSSEDAALDNVSENHIDAAAGSGISRTGFVKFAKSGWGFIIDGETQADVFFHWTDVEGGDFNELREGAFVTYVPGHNDRGPCARHVLPVAIAAARG